MGEKTIEIRHKSFNYLGDIVICCGKTNSVSSNAGKTLCIAELWKIRDMLFGDASAGGVRYSAGIESFFLRNR